MSKIKLDFQEQRLFDAMIDKFPDMIKNKQALWIEPIYYHFPNIIKKIQEEYEVEFLYDEETGRSSKKDKYEDKNTREMIY